MCDKGQGQVEQTRPIADAMQHPNTAGRLDGAKQAGALREDLIRPDGLYRHCGRGGRVCRVVCTSILDDLNIGVVTFQDINDSSFWTVSINKFNGYSNHAGVKRFTYIGQFFANR